MSVHNTEVHRCVECNEIVVIVPDGFSITQEELDQKAEDHRKGCPVLLERMLAND